MMLAPRTPAAPAIDMDGISGDPFALPSARRKRKAETPPENNERLSKRLSLLNLEKNGAKLYVPVENPFAQTTATLQALSSPQAPASLAFPHPTQLISTPSAYWSSPVTPTDSMHLDDTKHKVYIYNMDDELSDSDTDPSSPRDGKLVFLSDIGKHLRTNRIPPSLLEGPDPVDLNRQLVLYSVPSSLTVPEERDSVRKAVIEFRARMRERQRVERDGGAIGEHNMVLSHKATGHDGLATTPEAPAGNSVFPGMCKMQTGGLWGQAEMGMADGDIDMDAMELD